MRNISCNREGTSVRSSFFAIVMTLLSGITWLNERIVTDLTEFGAHKESAKYGNGGRWMSNLWGPRSTLRKGRAQDGEVSAVCQV